MTNGNFTGKYVEVRRNPDGTTTSVEKDFDSKEAYDAFVRSNGNAGLGDFDSIFRSFGNTFESFERLLDGPFSRAMDSFKNTFGDGFRSAVESNRDPDELDVVKKHERELALEKARKDAEKKKSEEEKKAREEELSRLKKSVDILKKYEKEWQDLGNEERVAEIRKDMENVQKRIAELSK